MSTTSVFFSERAEHRAASKPAHIPAGDRPMDPSDEGQT